MKNKIKIDFELLLGLILAAALFVFLGTKTSLNKNSASKQFRADILESTVKPVSAKEIYPMFLCPCCGQPLNPEKICCGQAKERIDYIDSEIKAGKSKNEIVIDFAKKYGLNSFVDKNKAEEFKNELIAIAPANRPIISLSPETYNFGDVSQRKGTVFAYYELKNEGKSDLIISKLDTSCGCTSASVLYKNEEGPRFAMAGHGAKNPTDWEIIIPGGQTAQLKVYYDPDVHKDFRGPAIREIYIFSNDPVDFEKKVKIELNQVD